MNVYYNEIEKFPCRVIESNIARGRLYPGRVHCADIKNVSPDDLRPFRQWHLFAGIGAAAFACWLAGLPDWFPICTLGFPCQDLSNAGKGAGLNGARSGLFFEALRLIKIIKPTWLLIENVPGLRTRGIEVVIQELEGAGYCVLPPIVVGADDIGGPHKRKRVWIVARRADEPFLKLADAYGDGQRGVSGETRQGQSRAQQWTDANGQGDGLDNSLCERHGQNNTLRSGGHGSICTGQQLANPNSAMFNGSGESGAGGWPKSTNGGESLADTIGQRLEIGADLAEDSKEECKTIERSGFESLADTNCAGCRTQCLECLESPPAFGENPNSITSCRWPSRPGEEQYEWEEPRTIEPALGMPTDGATRRLVRLYTSWRRNALKGLGNAWVPQTAAPILRWIYETEMNL